VPNAIDAPVWTCRLRLPPTTECVDWRMSRVYSIRACQGRIRGTSSFTTGFLCSSDNFISVAGEAPAITVTVPRDPGRRAGFRSCGGFAMLTDLVCSACGSTFRAQTYPSRPRKYCSRECEHRAHAQRPPALSEDERFWSKVDKTGDCWAWTGAKTRGYGAFQRSKARGTVIASRMAYELMIGPVPDGMIVCHRCDNPACVRPDHLFLGTDADNARDKLAKGREGHGGAAGDANGSRLHPEALVRGEAHPSARLTWLEVNEIRQRFAAGSVRKADLAREYGVSQGTIGSVLSGKTWTWTRVESAT
jgi:hypothetical protein